MADDVRPWTRSSVGAPCPVQPPQKNEAWSEDPTTTNANTTNPPKNINTSKKSSNPSTMPSKTTSPVEG